MSEPTPEINNNIACNRIIVRAEPPYHLSSIGAVQYRRRMVGDRCWCVSCGQHTRVERIVTKQMILSSMDNGYILESSTCNVGYGALILRTTWGQFLCVKCFGFGFGKTNHTPPSAPIGIMSDARHGFDEGGNSNAIISSPGQPSPGQKLLSSMVLGDGSFEASMKERSRVSSSTSHNAYSINFNTCHPSKHPASIVRR